MEPFQDIEGIRPAPPAGKTDHSESYSYDPDLDYLTGANYGDGLPNATPSWSYDAAANRTDTVADNLNRPVTIGGVSSTSDILGNRLTLGSQTYGWDCLNRMTSYGSNNSYVYRADGMRVSKLVGSAATKYFYDGQMGFEDQDGTSTVTDYGLGARGVDYISKTASGTTTVGFPIFDAHGNMTACLFRSGSTYSLANQRSYDAWGQVRQGSATGDPKGRYCGNLGHKHDDESGLVYMRARYYEPLCGRFLTEDPKKDGRNWFSYGADEPVQHEDYTGHFTILDLVGDAVDAAGEMATEYQQKVAVLGAMGITIANILENYAQEFGEALGDDFESVFGQGSRIWITGIDRGGGFQIAIDFAANVVKAYGSGGQSPGLPPGVPHYGPPFFCPGQ